MGRDQVNTALAAHWRIRAGFVITIVGHADHIKTKRVLGSNGIGMVKAEMEVKPGDSLDLLNLIRNLIEEASRQTAAAVNVGLTALYWRIGNQILREVLGNERATYGEQIVATLSRQLVADFGRGFEQQNLYRISGRITQGSGCSGSRLAGMKTGI